MTAIPARPAVPRPSAQTLKQTVKWVVVLLAVGVLGGGGYGYWMYSRTDELLVGLILQKQREFAPHWDVTIDRAHFDWHRRVRIYNMTVKVRGRREVVLMLPEVVVTIDHRQFKEQQKIVVDKVRLIRPEATLVRDGEGHWNWQDLLRFPRSDRSLPEWTVEQGTVYVRLDQADGSPPGRIALHKADMDLVPSGKREYRFQGEADVNHAGQLALRGELNMDTRRWTVAGEMQGLAVDGTHLNLAAGASPELRRRLHELDRMLFLAYERLSGGPDVAADGSMPPEAVLPAPGPPESDVPASSSPNRPAPLDLGAPPDSVPDFGVKGTLDVAFTAGRDHPHADLAFRMQIGIRQGQVAHPVLPFPLRDLSGRIDWDNSQVVVRNLSAKNGLTRVQLGGRVERRPESKSARLSVHITQLPLDERLRSRLPPELRQQFDLIQPTGLVDFDATLASPDGHAWSVDELLLTARDCTATNAKFPYPVTRITGTVRQAKDRAGRVDWVIDLEGLAARQTVRISGRVRQPGPDAEVALQVHAEQFPLDDRFLQASPEGLREMVRSLRLSGWADVDLRLHRPPGPGQRFVLDINAWLRECELEPEAFPYRLSQVSGLVRHISADEQWVFEGFRGSHGATQVAAAGAFLKNSPDDPGRLRLTIDAQNVSLNDTLRQALTADYRGLWDLLSPGGEAHCLADLTWVPGQEIEVVLPRLRVRNGSMRLSAFPYPLDKISADLSCHGDRVSIESFSGWHEETKVQFTGTAAVPPHGRWQVRLEDLHVDDLAPNRQFRQALPPELRSAVEEVDPQKPLSVSGFVELAGDSDQSDAPVTAAWELGFTLSGNRLTAGVYLDDIHGRVDFRGRYDGAQVASEGRADLTSLHFWGYQLTEVRGPFTLIGERLRFGSPETLDTGTQAADEDRIRCKVFGGRGYVDGEALLTEHPAWRLRAVMRDGDLENYSRRYLSGYRNLRGVVNGWINLANRSADPNRMTGEGQMQLSPAALYQMPVIAQVFQAMLFTPPDKAAFKYAFVDFGVAGGHFRFREIDLVGDAMTLRGQGTARFDGNLDIDFYSMLPRAQLARLPKIPIPGVNTVVGGALDEVTKGWVRVEVRGPVDNPEARMVPVPVLDDALSKFLEAFGNNPVPPNPFRAGAWRKLPRLPLTPWQ